SYASTTPVKRLAMLDGATDGGVGGAVGGGTGGAAGGGIGGATGASAGGAVGGAVGSAVGGLFGGSYGSALLGGLGSAALGGLGGVIGGAVGGALGGGMGGVLGGGLGAGVTGALGSNPCSNLTLCLNDGVCKPNGKTYICVCPKFYSGVNCQQHNSGRDTKELDDIISGSQKNYDHTVENVLERNKDWTDMLVVADVTKSMEA
ncbi:unnamed protein product, partial [Didymodactylos carnosus]